MHTVKFFGRISPAGVTVDFDGEMAAEYHDPDKGYSLYTKSRIKQSDVIVECTFNLLIPNYIAQAYSLALDMTRAFVDITAFRTGLGLYLNFEQWEDVDGKVTTLSFQNETAKTLCTAINDGNVNEILAILLAEPALFLALNDIVIAITAPHVLLINHARAVETIRQQIAYPELIAEKQWPIMRDQLNIDRQYLTLIMESSRNPRHGRRTYLPEDQLTKAIERTWTIMDRYFHYRLRGGLKLPENEFPLLVE